MTSTTLTTADAGPVKNALGIPARIAYLALAAGAVAGAIAIGGPLVLAAWLLPDVALIGGFAEPGRLRPAAVSPYNALHSLPPALAAIAAGAVLSPLVLALGLTWLSHIAFDRAAGYGLRAADGWQRA